MEGFWPWERCDPKIGVGGYVCSIAGERSGAELRQRHPQEMKVNQQELEADWMAGR